MRVSKLKSNGNLPPQTTEPVHQHPHPYPHPDHSPATISDRIPIPAHYQPILLSIFHQEQSAARQIEVLQSQLESLKNQAISAHGELTGLVKGIVISEKLDHHAIWDLSSDCTHLIKR